MKIKTDNYEIYKGDCLEVMDMLIAKGIKVDCILTDPPYGTTACKWDSVIAFDEMWEKCNKLLNNGCPIILFSAQPFTSMVVSSNIKNYKHHWIWEKNRGTGFQVAKYRPMMATEDIIAFSTNGKKINYYPQMIKLDKPYFSRNASSSNGTNPLANFNDGGKWVDSKYPTNILKYDKVSKPIHPTQKSVALLEYLIKTYTLEEETVLDFTMGSGSTGVACLNTNRKFIGIELDDKYFEISKSRLNEAVEKKEELLKVFDKSN